MEKNLNILVAAGGTGGHLFPAMAVVEEFAGRKDINFHAEFVGNPNKLEARVVPAAGYNFNPIPITGFTGLFKVNTFTLPFRILNSILKINSILKKAKAELVICTGAYISYPAGLAASMKGIPLVLMESNVNPGKTNKLLAGKANMIITSFEETAEYLPAEVRSKVVCLGNPIRKSIGDEISREHGAKTFGLDPAKKTVLIFGGSLGAKSINEAAFGAIERLENLNIQFIWQTGNTYTVKKEYPANIKIYKFIDDMASAYAASDLVISRSGATTLSELSIVGKPSILVPLSTASNNEQEFNAKVFDKNGAAILVKDNEIAGKIEKLILDLINDESRLRKMSAATSALAKKSASVNAADSILKLIHKD